MEEMCELFLDQSETKERGIAPHCRDFDRRALTRMKEFPDDEIRDFFNAYDRSTIVKPRAA